MLDNIKWLGHSTIKILGDKIIYIDPYNVLEKFNDADIIFITHSHYDHFSIEDIKKVYKQKTKIVITEDLYEEVLKLGFEEKDIMSVLPNNHYNIENLNFNTIAAYNTNKEYHPKENNWVGYIIEINNIKYYITGDTDLTNEAKQVKCDIAFLPVGGTFTMNYHDAALLANEIAPKIVIPIHYGTLVGTKDDALNFKKEVKENIKCEIL